MNDQNDQSNEKSQNDQSGMSREDAGRKGGEATLRKYGRKHFSQMGQQRNNNDSSGSESNQPSSDTE